MGGDACIAAGSDNNRYIVIRERAENRLADGLALKM